MSEEALYLLQLGFEGTDWERGAEGNITIINDKPSIVYPILSGGFSYLANWQSAQFQWVNPVIPQSIRDYVRGKYDYRAKNWVPMARDYSLSLETIPEKDALGELSAFGMNFWAPFIFDKSNAVSKDLYAKLKANMDAAGYKAAKDAMNARAKTLGL
jgi:hypothetical protein